MTRLGPRQLAALQSCGPSSLCVTLGKVEASLVRDGLIEQPIPDGGCCITPAGLRRLADEIDAGRLPSLADRWRERANKAAAEKDTVTREGLNG